MARPRIVNFFIDCNCQVFPFFYPIMGYLELRELDSITTAKRSVSIDLSVGELQLFGMRLNEVKLTARQLRRAWRISVDSTDLKGEFVVPMEYESGIPLVMEMEYLKLNGNFRAVESLDVAPQNLPAIRIRCHRLQRLCNMKPCQNFSWTRNTYVGD